MVRLARFAWLALLALGAAACSSESTTAIDVGPTGDPTIVFADPSSSDAQPVCVAVGSEADARVPLLVDTTELVLRPPGACGYYVQCVHLDLTVDGVSNDESAAPAIDLLLRKLADRYHDGSPRADNGQPDVLHVEVSAVGDAEQPVSNHEGVPLKDTLQLVTKPSCD
jgi:hypothetical protein